MNMPDPKDILAATFGLLACLVAFATHASALSAEPEQLKIELNEGYLLRLDRPATSVFIANPEIADINVKSARLVYVFGKQPGETSLYAIGAGDNVIADLRVSVSHSLSRLDEALARLLPASLVTTTSVDGGIVLSGAVQTAAEAENARRLATRFIGEDEEIINRLDVTAPNQVNLRVRVAEVSRQVIDELGFNWESAILSGFTLGLATGTPVVAESLTALGTLSPASGSILTRQNNPAGNIFGKVHSGSFDLNLLIDAMAEDGLVSVLAEPNLTALSGETASFLAGGEFPIPVPQGDGRITIEFKKFGVSLDFTPTSVNGDRISMHVRPEVSQLSNNGAIQIGDFIIPALSTRRAETTVELGSGQSFAIAGLLLDNSMHDSDKIPGLGDLPVLGQLFQSDRFERSESELVIIVTPYVVRPAPATAMAAITDSFVGIGGEDVPRAPAAPSAASGAQRTLPIITAANSQPALVGPAGFIVE